MSSAVLGTPRGSRYGTTLALSCAATAVALGAAVVRAPAVPFALAGGVALAYALIRRPMILWGVALALLVAVPYYAVPNVGGEPLVPAALVLWILGLRLLVERRRVASLVALDAVALGLTVAMSLAVAAHVRSIGDLYREIFLWAGPYLGARYAWARSPVLATRLVVLAGTALLPFVAIERATGDNPFRHFSNNNLAAEVWAPALDRFNGIRPEASFGHPIALSMFLAFAAVLALGLSIAEEGGRQRLLWFIVAVVLTAAQALTLSRTGWVVIASAILALLPSVNRLMRRPYVVISVTIAAIALLIAPQGQPVRQLLESPFVGTSRSSELITSTDHRTEQLRQVRRGGVIRAFGNREPQLMGSVDNEYLLLGDRWGLAVMLAFLALVPTVAFKLLRCADPLSRSVTSAALGLLLGLLFVALITQQQVAVWMALGMVASGSTRRASRT